MEILQPSQPIWHENFSSHAWAAPHIPQHMLANPTLSPQPQLRRLPAVKRGRSSPEAISIKRRRAPIDALADTLAPAPVALAPLPVATLPPTSEAHQFEVLPAGNPYRLSLVFSPASYFGSRSVTPVTPPTPPSTPTNVDVVLEEGDHATPLKRINLLEESHLEFSPELRKQLRKNSKSFLPHQLPLPTPSTALITHPMSQSPARFPLLSPVAKPRTWSVEEIEDDDAAVPVKPASHTMSID